jgi:integrase
MIKKDSKTDKYLVDFYPSGRSGKRCRKLFSTKAEATRYKQHVITEAVNKPWLPEKDDNRRLSELVDLWFTLHGQSLSDGVKRKRKLLAMVELMEDPIARKFQKSDFSLFRTKRLEQVSIKTVNNDQTYFNALFNELIRLGEWKYENPIIGLRALKYKTPEMGFLTSDEIPLVFDELKKGRNTDTYLVAKICLSTGCRWSEAEQMKGSQISKNRITFINTKGNKNRTVPISDALFAELPKSNGRLFSNCIKAFAMAVKRAGVQLPKGQSTHVLRHTFASHFMMNGGNILVLKEILGHSSITDTMKYAHFSPTHLEDAVRLNPFNQLE